MTLTLKEIREEIDLRLAVLQEAVDEMAALQKMKAILDDVLSTQEAPYGYKADGTPRKRPAPSLRQQAKSAATRRAKAKAKDNEVMAQMPRRRRSRSKGVTLNVQTVTGPTKDEMKDRELALATSQ